MSSIESDTITIIDSLEMIRTTIDLSINWNLVLQNAIDEIDNKINDLEAQKEHLIRQLNQTKNVNVEGYLTCDSVEVIIQLIPIPEPFPSEYIKLAKKVGISVSKDDPPSLLIRAEGSDTKKVSQTILHKWDIFKLKKKELKVDTKVVKKERKRHKKRSLF